MMNYLLQAVIGVQPPKAHVNDFPSRIFTDMVWWNMQHHTSVKSSNWHPKKSLAIIDWKTEREPIKPLNIIVRNAIIRSEINVCGQIKMNHMEWDSFNQKIRHQTVSFFYIFFDSSPKK